MGNDLEALAKSLAAATNGADAGISMDKIVKVLSTESGRKVLAALMSDGGSNVKNAANAAKNGDLSGVMKLISSISSTKDGAEVLSQITDSSK